MPLTDKEPKGTAQEYLAEIGLMGGYDMAFDDEMLQVDPANFELSAEMLSAAYDLQRAYSVVRQQIAEFEQVARSEGLDLSALWDVHQGGE
jgi:hypothetical protein